MMLATMSLFHRPGSFNGPLSVMSIDALLSFSFLRREIVMVRPKLASLLIPLTGDVPVLGVAGLDPRSDWGEGKLGRFIMIGTGGGRMRGDVSGVKGVTFESGWSYDNKVFDNAGDKGDRGGDCGGAWGELSGERACCNRGV